MTNTDLKELLDALHDKYNSPDFIADDPISVPRRPRDRGIFLRDHRLGQP